MLKTSFHSVPGSSFRTREKIEIHSNNLSYSISYINVLTQYISYFSWEFHTSCRIRTKANNTCLEISLVHFMKKKTASVYYTPRKFDLKLIWYLNYIFTYTTSCWCRNSFIYFLFIFKAVGGIWYVLLTEKNFLTVLVCKSSQGGIRLATLYTAFFTNYFCVHIWRILV